MDTAEKKDRLCRYFGSLGDYLRDSYLLPLLDMHGAAERGGVKQHPTGYARQIRYLLGELCEAYDKTMGVSVVSGIGWGGAAPEPERIAATPHDVQLELRQIKRRLSTVEAYLVDTAKVPT